MPKFKYKALNLDGEKVEGQEEAPSKGALVGILESQSLLLLSARKTAGHQEHPAKGGSRTSLRPVKIDSLVLFTRQFATMFRVGVPLLRILYILKDQVENQRLQMIIASIAKDVESGSSLADAFSKYPGTFPQIYCSMLAAGEASGNIAVVMEKLCDSMEYEHEVKNVVKNAFQYPTMVFCALIVAFAILMGFVIPAFIPLFDQLGGEVPALTKICIGVSKLFTDYWIQMLTAMAIAIGLLIAFARTDNGRLAIDRFLLRIPLTGKLLKFSFMARIASLLSILQASGILIVEGLNIIADCIHNKSISREIAQLAVDVESGKSISASLKNSKNFPLIMQSMISIGEASGNLEEMMQEASGHFEVEVKHAVKRLTGAIGPILVVIMALVVGFFALAIYLPIWEINSLQMHQ